MHPLRTIEHDLPLRREGDRLYGPGVYDMKGGAYLALQAFKHVAARGAGALPLVYLVTPDEEIGSPTTRALIEDFGRRSAYTLVLEPARDGGKIVTSRKGVGRFDVRVEGRPAHAGSRHEDGRSAVREAARQILRIENMTDYGRGVTTTVGTIVWRQRRQRHPAALPLHGRSPCRHDGGRRGLRERAPQPHAA